MPNVSTISGAVNNNLLFVGSIKDLTSLFVFWNSLLKYCARSVGVYLPLGTLIVIVFF